MPYIGQGLTEGRRRLHNFVATSNQTTFIATYDVGYVDVYQNGILLTSTDYTATNGTTVVLAVGASSTDEITIIAHQIFSVTDTVSAITGGAFGGNVDVTGNITTTGSIKGPSSFTIDPATHGDNTGTVVIAGDLTVNGTTTTINSTTLTVDDKNLIIASGTSNSSTADGSGLTIDLGSDGTATMTYTHATTSFDFNKPVNVAGNLGVTGTVDGIDIATRDAVLTSTTTTAGAALPKAGGTMTGDIDGAGNKVLFANVYAQIADLPSPSTYHGMFAHVHATGKGYFAHAGAWIVLANDADKLNLSGGAMTGDLTITSNVGIGTNNPSALQQNYIDSGSANLGLRLTQNNSGQGIWMEFQPGNNTDDWQVGANNSGFAIYNVTDSRYDMIIDGTGNALIGKTGNLAGARVLVAGTKSGTNGTNGQLVVLDEQGYGTTDNGGGISFAGNFYNGGQVVFATVQGVKANNTDANNAGALKFTTKANGANQVEAMRIASDGKVGIGETSPLGKLHVKTADSGATVDPSADEFVIEGSANTGMSILSGAGNTGSIYFGDSGTNWDGYIAYSQASRQMTLGVAAGGGSVNIDSSGKVGIGESSPANILHIKTSASGGPQIELDSTSGTANSGFIGFDGTSLQLATQRDMVNGSKRDTAKSWGGINIVGAAAGSYIQLQTSEGNNNNASTRMTITKEGNVGIGATNPGGARLYLQDTHTTTVTNATTMLSNATLIINGNSSQGSDVLRAGPMGTAGRYFMDVSNSAGNAAYNLLLNPISGGNVGIGTTSANKHLHVYGTNPTIQVQGDSSSYYPNFNMTGLHGGIHLGTYWGGNITSQTDFSIRTGGTSGDGGTQQLKIQNSSGALKTYGNTFHIHAGQGTTSHANEFQFLTTELATPTSGSWYDVCYVSHSPNLRFHGMSVQSNNTGLGGARYMGALVGTYGSVACYQEQKRVTAMNGGGVTDIDYRYLNSGASSGSYRLQVKLNFSGSDYRVYTCVYGNATAEISKDGY